MKKNNLHRVLSVLAVLVLVVALMTTAAFAASEDGGESGMYGTFWALVPPIVAIALALITKEAYSSLFVRSEEHTSELQSHAY